MFRPQLPNDTVPVFDTNQWVAQVEAALTALPERYHGTFHSRWASMDVIARHSWVRRRKAALTIIWVRGGSDGLRGLGKRLPDALSDIDR